MYLNREGNFLLLFKLSYFKTRFFDFLFLRAFNVFNVEIHRKSAYNFEISYKLKR